MDISNIKNVIEVYAELRERITVLENNVSTSEEDIVKLKELILKFSEDIKDLEQQGKQLIKKMVNIYLLIMILHIIMYI